MNDPKFNRAAVHLQLSGAKIVSEKILKEIETLPAERGIGLGMVDCEQMLYRLCLAWHYQWLTDEQIDEIPGQEFERLRKTIPDFGFKLAATDDSEPGGVASSI